MFWDKGYTPSQNIEALLEKENVTVEEFLDDDDILQECKTLKKNIINYFTRPDVIRRLIEFITTEPDSDLPLARQFRYANMACEILTVGLPSLDEKVLSDPDTLKILYSYLENEPPLNPLLSSFFNKTFSMLFTKKAEQDWFLYQQMCLKLLEYIKSQNNFLDLICKHFTTPVIPDLIMQMMRDMEGGHLRRNLYDWLTEDRIVERLIEILGDPEQTEKHSNVSEFLCDLIQQGRAMRQNENENDSFELVFDGSNPILKRIESEATIKTLLNVILEPNAQESTVISGISVVLMLLKPVILIDEPFSVRIKNIHQRENEIHQQILKNVIQVVAPRLKDFNDLLRNPPNCDEIVTTAATLKPPFGMTRLQICRIFTVLLQTRNEEISKAICETDFFETLLQLFKNYCWNNFLHNEVEKCLQLVFYSSLTNNNNSTQGSIIVNDGSFSKNSNNGDNHTSFFEFMMKNGIGNSGMGNNDSNNMEVVYEKQENETADDQQTDKEIETNATDVKAGGESVTATTNNEQDEKLEAKCEKNEEFIKTEIEEPQRSVAATAGEPEFSKEIEKSTKEKTEENDEVERMEVTEDETEQKDVQQQETQKRLDQGEQTVDETMQQSEIANDVTKVPADIAPTALQTHVIVNCKVISKLIDCWKHNSTLEAVNKGRRLGYMGHLIKIFKHITNCISESEHIGALVENNLSDANELELWQSIVNPNDGDLTKALAIQSRMLANCNALETSDYSGGLSKDFLTDNSTWDFIMQSNMLNSLGPFGDSSSNDIVFGFEHEMYRNDLLDNDDNAENDINLLQFGRNIDDDDDDDDDENSGGTHGLFHKQGSLAQSSAHSKSRFHHILTNNPWDGFNDLSDNSNSQEWAADFGSDNFADFDAHFSSFTNDLGESLTAAAGKNESLTAATGKNESDNTEKNEKRSSSADAGTADVDVVCSVDSVTGGGGENEMLNTTASSDEYDNNANVETSSADSSKLSDDSNKFLSDDTTKSSDEDNEKIELNATAAVVRTLQTVMQDSEDDYEDDEGMWTKPLGGNTDHNTQTFFAQEDEIEKELEAVDSLTYIHANGPSKEATTEDDNDLNDEKKEKLFNIINSTIITIQNEEETQINCFDSAKSGVTKDTTATSAAAEAAAVKLANTADTVPANTT